jgi:thiol-disulfide isomerase/thioredoxin
MRVRTALLALFAALSLSAQQAEVQEGKVAALAREGHSRPDTKTWERHAELLGRPAPKLDLYAWMNGGAEPDDMKGRIVVIDFWATWRRPCIDAVPRNNATAKGYAGRGVSWIGVCGSGRGEDLMGTIVKDAWIAYPVCHAGPGTAEAWRVEYWPTYGVIDRNGILRALGVERDYVEPIIDALLEEEGAAPGEAWARESTGSGAQARAAGGRGAQTQRPGGGGSPDNFRFGYRTLATILQNRDVWDYFGGAVGYCVFTERMFTEMMAVGFLIEYSDYVGHKWANGAKTDASQWKLGADLILRSEGIKNGFFVFAGVGYVIAEVTAVGRTTVSVGGSGTFTSLGVGYDWSSLGFELRYISPSFLLDGFNFSGTQLGIRTRF